MRIKYQLGAALLFCLGASAQTSTSYTVTNLVTNATDASLVNPWGLSRPANNDKVEPHWWASDQVTGVSTLYNADGSVEPLIVTVPPSGATVAGGGTIGSPTGTVAFKSGTKDYFLFSTLDGTISAWPAYTRPATPGKKCLECHISNATVMVDHSALNASYQGLAVANNGGVEEFYVANANGGVEAYDTSFNQISLASGAFTDPKIPSTYSPAGIQAIGSTIYVTYNAIAGGGTGYVDAFDTNGNFKFRFSNGTKGSFNQPWGVTKSPSNFGLYSNSLLVGNTGNGWIGAYSATGKFKGFLKDSGGNTISIPGLWGLGFGAGNPYSGPTNVLYFNAGGPDLTSGTFGAIAAN